MRPCGLLLLGGRRGGTLRDRGTLGGRRDVRRLGRRGVLGLGDRGAVRLLGRLFGGLVRGLVDRLAAVRALVDRFVGRLVGGLVRRGAVRSLGVLGDRFVGGLVRNGCAAARAPAGRMCLGYAVCRCGRLGERAHRARRVHVGGARTLAGGRSRAVLDDDVLAAVVIRRPDGRRERDPIAAVGAMGRVVRTPVP